MGRNWAEFLEWEVGGGEEASSTYPFPPPPGLPPWWTAPLQSPCSPRTLLLSLPLSPTLPPLLSLNLCAKSLFLSAVKGT